MGDAKRRADGVTESCGSCRFFRRMAVGMPGGVCRARSPVPMVVGMVKHPTTGDMFPKVNTYWPEVPDSEWCGYFERKVFGAGIDLSKLAVEELEGTGD